NNVDPGDPLLVGVAVHRPRGVDALRGSDDPSRDTGALGEVVVVGAGAVTLDVGARGARGASVELHPAMHSGPPPPRRPSTTNGPSEMPRGSPDHGRPIYVPS